MCEVDSSGSEWVPVAECCKESNKSPDYIKVEYFLSRCVTVSL